MRPPNSSSVLSWPLPIHCQTPISLQWGNVRAAIYLLSLNGRTNLLGSGSDSEDALRLDAVIQRILRN